MKLQKLKFISVFSCLFILMSCVTKNNQADEQTQQQKSDTQEGRKMDYLEKYQIRNEIAFDCPKEVYEQRSDVKIGTVKHVTYHSNTCNADRNFNILLPASYDGVKKYPVIYFQHGIFGDENCMINDESNKFKTITANLAADGNAKEVIMVFGHMYASDNPELKPGFSAEAVAPYDNFINELVNDIMPYVEKNYAVLTGRENTAICGFSMGGRETLYIGLQRSDLFGYIGAIAPAPGLVPAKDWAMSHEGQLSPEQMRFIEGNPVPELLMVCCGTNDGTVGQFPKTYHKIFNDNGVEHLWFEIMSADHNNIAIRGGFYQFMLSVFQ